MNLHIGLKLAIAAVSGALVALTWDLEPRGSGWARWLVSFALPGTLFAAGVLWPYLSRTRHVVFKASSLLLASTLSYYGAYYTVVNWGNWLLSLPWSAVVSASAIGCAVVMASAWLVVPLRVSAAYVVSGLLAALAGGTIWHLCIERDAVWWTATGYAAWHCAVCAAIHFGSPSTAAGQGISRYLTGAVGRLKSANVRRQNGA